MKLYHGSKSNFEKVNRNQAGNGPDMAVPKDELLNAIYLTPDYGFAMACAVRPLGQTKISNENKTLEFVDHPELFDPEQEIFIYEFDVDNIPENKIRKIDELQYVVDLDELEISNKTTHKAGEIEKYYKIVEDKKEHVNEMQNHFKLR